MTIGLEVKIFRALTDHLDIFVANEGLTVAKPGLSFAPTSGTTYLRAYCMPATTEGLTVAGDVNEYVGFFQVNVFQPEGGGVVAAMETAAALAAHFATGTAVSHQGVSFSILRPPHVGPAIEEPGWIMLPVSIRYRAFLAP